MSGLDVSLDEQLLGRDIDMALAHWYRGPVLFITDLRPGTVIKDDAIPVLLRQQQDATFLTINETDFGKRLLSISIFAWFVLQYLMHMRT